MYNVFTQLLKEVSRNLTVCDFEYATVQKPVFPMVVPRVLALIQCMQEKNILCILISIIT